MPTWDRAKARQYKSQRRMKWRAAGKCRQCGGEPKAGRTLCAGCTQAQARAGLKYRIKKATGGR